jgi:D-serine deaminase-like pyridoxal phosphate-dependent protein
MASNIATMAGRIRAHGVSWRPHTKGQKVPAIAHKLLGGIRDDRVEIVWPILARGRFR